MDDTDDYKDHVLFANLNYSMILLTVQISIWHGPV